MLTRNRWVTAAAIAAAVLTLSVTFPPAARAGGPAVDPAAVGILKQMTTFLDGLQQFSVKTESSIEELHVSGHRIDRDLAATVTVKRPNKLRAARAGEAMNQQFFYDGRTLTLYSPVEKVYASAAAPDTIERMIDFARETVGILLPSADLLYRDAYPLLIRDLSLATVVGKTVVGGVPCHHLLFVRPGVDFQVWVADGERPWPLKYVVTETGTPALLSISTVLSEWNTAPAVDDAQFDFVPPKGTSATRFIPVETTDGTGR